MQQSVSALVALRMRTCDGAGPLRRSQPQKFDCSMHPRRVTAGGVSNTTQLSISERAPSVRYYRAVEGSWRAALRWSLSNEPATPSALPQPLARVLGEALTLVGTLSMETSVDATNAVTRAEVIHTTRIAKWGLTLYTATETFQLDPDGTHVAIQRRERSLFSPRWRTEHGRSHAKIDASAKRASYQFPLLGTILHQTSTIEEFGVNVVQEIAQLRGEALLTRSASA